MPLPTLERGFPFQYEVISTPEAAEKLVAALMEVREDFVAFDTETIGWNPKDGNTPVHRARCVVWSLCWAEDKAFTILNYGKYSRLMAVFKPWLESEDHPKVLHNAKFDMHVMANEGVWVRGVVMDTLVGAGLLNERNRLSLEHLCYERFGEAYQDFKQTFGRTDLIQSGSRRHLKAQSCPGLESVVFERDGAYYQPGKLNAYAAKDAWLELRLAKEVFADLRGRTWYEKKTSDGGVQTFHMLDYYQRFEAPTTYALFEMERRGVFIDAEVMTDYDKLWRDRMDLCEAEFIDGLAKLGVPQSLLAEFRPGRDRLLVEILYDVLKYPSGRRSGRTNARSVDASELTRLFDQGYEVVKPLLDYNVLKKLTSTYTGTLPKMMDSSGRVHTTFNHNAARTGRLSSSSPNVQNIPSRGSFGDELRACFTAPEGRTLVVGDLSQIEYRMMAHESKDPEMVEGFKRGEDFHTLIARQLFPKLAHLPAEAFQSSDFPEAKDARSKSKTINFGILFGMGKFKLAKSLKVPEEMAAQFLKMYYKKFSQLPVFKAKMEAYAREHGYVRTYLRRYRDLPDIYHEDAERRSKAERQATNTAIQGGAADLMKLSMILVHQDKRLREMKADLLLNVHDELVLECDTADAPEVCQILKKHLEHPLEPFGIKPLSVPLLAEVKSGANWHKAK